MLSDNPVGLLVSQVIHIISSTTRMLCYFWAFLAPKMDGFCCLSLSIVSLMCAGRLFTGLQKKVNNINNKRLGECTSKRGGEHLARMKKKNHGHILAEKEIFSTRVLSFLITSCKTIFLFTSRERKKSSNLYISTYILICSPFNLSVQYVCYVKRFTSEQGIDFLLYLHRIKTFASIYHYTQN